jgi:hypothetical protein
MPRFDPRLLVLVPLLASAAACGDDAEPAAPPPSAAASAPAPSALPPSAPASTAPAAPQPSDSVYVEEDEEPTPEPGELPGEAQAHLDEALGIELGALEGAPGETAKQKRATLDKLPDNPTQVLAALRNYAWYSPEARAAYDRAVAAAR